MLAEMCRALTARGLNAQSRVTGAGPVIVVSGTKGELLCLVTEAGFEIDAWADGIKARLS